MRLAPAQLLCAAALALLALPVGCGVSTGGLGAESDAAAGAGGSAWCPIGLTHQASWPASSTATSCAQLCGPDDLGVATCRQTDLATCKQGNGCVCLVEPCVACGDCNFLNLPDCYIPANASSPPACEGEVSKGKACAPACGKHLCLRKDGKTGCICNAQGKYACGEWGSAGWK